MQTNPKLTVLGAGYIGLTTAALFAHSGFSVYLVDPDKKRLNVIKTGRSFFHEKGLDPIIKSALKMGTLIPTDSYSESIPQSPIVLSCVGTPDNPDGSFNLTYVFNAVKEASKFLKTDSIFVQKSTVPVGTGNQIEKILNKSNRKVHYVSNPEFLREGISVYDTLCFDRIVVGGKNKKTIEKIFSIYRCLEDCRDSISILTDIEIGPNEGKYIATSINSAELIKISSNAFLAMKISFANSIAKLADQVDADIIEVMDAVGADKRIGRDFLNAGRGYGGGCLPKDVSGLIASGIQNGVDLEIIKSTQSINDSMPGYIIEKLQKNMDGNIKDKTIAVLGMSFKAGIDDTRRSPGILIANLLDKAGANVSIFDPQVKAEFVTNLHKNISWSQSIDDAINKAEAIIIATEWPDFIEYDVKKYASKLHGKKIFVDGINRFSKSDITNAGLTYIGVGR